MKKVAYICDAQELGLDLLGRSEDILKEKIKENNSKNTFSIVYDGEVFAYNIHKNEPLTKIYSFDFYMVDFIFSGVTLLHNQSQKEVILKLLASLKEDVERNKGYYNFRIPTHIVDLINGFNQVFKSCIFCGGLVTYLSEGRDIESFKNLDIDVFLADENYLISKEDELIEIANDAFGEYQGQYHISYITEEMASEIYTDWIKKGFTNRLDKEKVIVAEKDDQIMGFWTYTEDEFSHRVGLTGVSKKSRGLGAYSQMLNFALGEVQRAEKFMTIGTQFDNFVVQRVWNKYGMKPYLSYYSIHIDNI